MTWSWPGNVRRSVWAGLCLGLAFFGCKPKAQVEAAPVVEEEAAEVETLEVGESAVPRSLVLTGALRADEEAEVAAGVSGRAIEVLFARNSVVKRGDVLARVDVGAAALGAAEAQTQAESAAVARANAEREARRAAELAVGGVLSSADNERSALQFEMAKLAARAAELRAAMGQRAVSDGIVRAPFGGVVSERFVDPGEYLMPSTRVATLIVVDPLRLEVFVPEAHLAAVAVKTQVTFRVAADPKRDFAGEVHLIGAVVRPATRDVLVEATVPNPDRALRPGMFAAVSLPIGDMTALVVPRSALVPHDDRSHLFVVKNGRLEERVVALGSSRGDNVAVLHGLSAGDRVVLAPSAALKNGQPVR